MADKEVRLIDKDKLIKKINAEIDAWGKARMCMTADELLETIEEFEEEAQPVKHGRWILSDDKNWLTCSFCGAEVDVSCGAPFFYVDNEEVSHINFCPNCGYKQDLDGGDING